MTRVAFALAAAALLDSAMLTGCSSCRRTEPPTAADPAVAAGAAGAASPGGPAPTTGSGTGATAGEAHPAQIAGAPAGARPDGGAASDDPPGRGDEGLCRTLGLDAFDGQRFDEGKVAGLLAEDALLVRRAADEIVLCRALAAPDDAECDKAKEPFGCRFQRALLLDARGDFKDPAWGATFASVLQKAPGADAARIAAARQAIGQGAPDRCPREWDACAALASGDEKRCPDAQQSGDCGRDARRLRLLRTGGLDGLKDDAHDRVLADAARGRGSCRKLVDEFFDACVRATADSELRQRRRPRVVGPSKTQAMSGAVPPPGGAPLPSPPPAPAAPRR